MVMDITMHRAATTIVRSSIQANQYTKPKLILINNHSSMNRDDQQMMTCGENGGI